MDDLTLENIYKNGLSVSHIAALREIYNAGCYARTTVTPAGARYDQPYAAVMPAQAPEVIITKP